MDQLIFQILTDLRNGQLLSAYNNKSYINDKAIQLYNKGLLSQDDITDLGHILNIGNITYNNTDKELLPIEDGLYDLLLEKYKLYQPYFQVGAEPIHFEPYSKSTITPPMKEVVEFLDPIPMDNLEVAAFANDIVVPQSKFVDIRDFENTSLPARPTDIYIPKRKHNTAHEHPELVGTLDKCKFVTMEKAIENGVDGDSNVKVLERDFFQEHIKRGIIDPNTIFDMAVELKYDGVSVEADCTEIVISARSRGDTGIGKASDLTPLLNGYRFPHRPEGSPMVGVKFEAIITQDDLPYFNMAKGYTYKNCRSAIVGLMASSDAWKYRDFITLVPLAVENKVYREQCHSNRFEEILYLNQNFISKGCPLRWAPLRGTYIENLIMIDLFAKNAESLRYLVPFMYDGIVVSYVDENIRQQLGRENYVNKFSIAVKFNPTSKLTTFRGYSYTVGQDGSITPIIHYDPVEFNGTIHDKSSGHSYARFNELNLHIGDTIEVKYVNDVMPYVFKPETEHNTNNLTNPLVKFPTVCPICGTELVISSSNKSVRCPNPNCQGKQLARMVNMCQKLNMDGFGESTIMQLGVYHLADLGDILLNPTWSQILLQKGFGPVESVNIKNQFDNLIQTPLADTEVLGALGFTNISTKTWELILSNASINNISDQLLSVKGIGSVTVSTILNELPFFQRDIDWAAKYMNLYNRSSISNKPKIVMSGFRDKELARSLEDLGYNVDLNGNVTKDTAYLIVPEENFVSQKVDKANKYGIPILIAGPNILAQIENHLKF